LTNNELYEILPPSLDSWQAAHGPKEGVTWDDSYPVRKDCGFRERVWFWCRPVTGESNLAQIGSPLETSRTTPSNGNRAPAMRAVARSCGVSYRQHGRKHKSGQYLGWYDHDWGHLVQEVNRIYGGEELSIASAWNAGNAVRLRFKNISNWDHAVNAPGAHDEILDIILRAIT
jgi:hypothetical protein